MRKCSPRRVRAVTGTMASVAACLVLLAPLASRAEAEAVATVESLHGNLLEVMQNAAELGFEGRRERLDEVAPRLFDIAYISRLVLGSGWKDLEDEQRRDMIATFRRLMVNTYAARFDGYSGETFSTVKVRDLRKDRVQVRTELIKSDGEAVTLDYVLHREDGPWQIVNVVANGVSDLALKRAEYTAILDDEGFEELIARLQAQSDSYAKGTAD